MLAILTTHPIQYQVPLWKALAARGKVPFRVFYMSNTGLKESFDRGFGRELAWDIDLLSGYDHEFIDVRTSSSPDSFLWLRLKRGFSRMLAERSVRALWIQGWQVAAYWQAVLEAQRIDIEVWLRGETNLRSSRNNAVQGLNRAVLRLFLNRVDRFLFIGEANRQFYLSYGIQANQMIAAPYCVDNDRFAHQASRLRPDRLALRRQWCIPDDAFCFLFLGKFIPKKRPADLIAAVHRLQKKGAKRPLHLLFVGTGELDEELRHSCIQSCIMSCDTAERSRGASEATPLASFVGFLNQTEVSRAYVAADCLVLPSDGSETWGLVVNEAMASGLPCVASNSCGCVEDLILPICPELSYTVGDIGGLQQCLEMVMARPPATSVLENLIENYNISRTVEAVEQLYAQVIAN